MPIASVSEGSGAVTSRTPVGYPSAPSAPGSADGAISNPIIPDAGVYGEETAAAVNAYNNAVAAATAQRNALYNQYGLTSDGTVDPNNPEGAYQQMLGHQADQYHSDDENSAGRGLRGGLAHQAESHDRRDALAQDFQFQTEASQVGTDYQKALQDALGTKTDAISGAYNDALNKAMSDMLGSMGSGSYTAPGTGAGDSTAAIATAKAHHAAHAAIHHVISKRARKAGSHHHSGR